MVYGLKDDLAGPKLIHSGVTHRCRQGLRPIRPEGGNGGHHPASVPVHIQYPAIFFLNGITEQILVYILPGKHPGKILCRIL